MTAVFPAGTRSACLVGCLLAWLPAVAAEQPVRGELEAVMVEQAPKLDGTLDDPLWQKCPPLVLGGCGGDGPLEPRTEARVLFGPTTVFIAVACDEPNTDDLVAKVRERDGEVWGDDCVEIHVSGDHRLGDHQFIVNPAGTLYDARDKDRPGTRGPWWRQAWCLASAGWRRSPFRWRTWEPMSARTCPGC